MKNPFSRFLVRWLVCALGLWIAAGILANGITYGDNIWVVIIAGLVLAAINSVIKPIVIILSLPAIVVTLGLFMIVVNALMVLLASWLVPPLHVSGFGTALLAGIIIGLVNYLVTTILSSREEAKK